MLNPTKDKCNLTRVISVLINLFRCIEISIERMSIREKFRLFFFASRIDDSLTLSLFMKDKENKNCNIILWYSYLHILLLLCDVDKYYTFLEI